MPKASQQQHARTGICLVALGLAMTVNFGARAADGLALEEVAPGVLVYQGSYADADPANLGAIANAGVIVGEAAVAVIDTGGSLAFGRRLREAIRALTSLPIRFVINTHVHPDHIFGNAAFVADEPEFVGHYKLPRAMAGRGPHYLRSFGRLIGPDFEGSRLVPPNLTVVDTLELDLGARKLSVTAHPSAHTDNDLSVLDVRTGTLFAGDLVFLERIPVVDGSLDGWLKLMREWRGLAARRVVPGHGPSRAPWPQALADQERYFRVLLAGVREVISRGGGIREATRTVGREERDRWLLFENNHQRNVTATFTELEWE